MHRAQIDIDVYKNTGEVELQKQTPRDKIVTKDSLNSFETFQVTDQKDNLGEVETPSETIPTPIKNNVKLAHIPNPKPDKLIFKPIVESLA